MLPFLAATTMAVPGDLDAATFRSWGTETLTMIRQDYALPDSKLLGERLEDSGKANQPAFNWGVGVMLSALAAGSKVDPQYKDWLREYADATRVYWNDKGPVPGYDVLPGPKDVDRYYDDNAWMAMALVDTYEVLGDAKYLKWAEETVDYVLSGEDDVLEGGVYWKEAEKSSKNTCSNGPAAAAALSVYQHNKKPEYLAAAKRIYGWCHRRLQDPTDHLYWDNINLNGTIGEYKWSYNSGLMLRSAVELYKATGEDQYRRDAIQLESVSRHWLSPDGSQLKDEGKFAHLLFENLVRFGDVAVGPTLWTASYTAKSPKIDIRKALSTTHEAIRDANGHYGGRWDRPVKGKVTHPMLIDQASAARAFFVAAASLAK